MVPSYQEIKKYLEDQPHFIHVAAEYGPVSAAVYYYTKTTRGNYICYHAWDTGNEIWHVVADGYGGTFDFHFEAVTNKSWYMKRYFAPILMEELL